MKLTITTIMTGLAAAAALTLTSCGDGNTASEESTDTGAPAVEKAAYPLDVCVVSGEKLGSMGEPYVITHEGTEVRFCCKECLPKFNEDPDKYVAMLKEGTAGSMEHGNHNH